jgi:sugar phosphate isomerase/epimerase
MRRLPFAINSLMLWNHPADQAASLAAGYGFAGIEIWIEQIRCFDTPLDKIAAAIKAHDLRLTLHAPSWDLNLCALNQTIRRQSLAEIQQALTIAAELQAIDITVHPGRATLPQPWHSYHLDLMTDSFIQLANQAERLGVTISIELMEPAPGELITEPAHLNALLEKLPPGLQTTLDVSHLPSESDLPYYLGSLQKIGKIHFSNRSLSQYHLPLDTGIFDCRKLLQDLSPTRLPLVIEGFDASPEHHLLDSTLAFLQADPDLKKLITEA